MHKSFAFMWLSCWMTMMGGWFLADWLKNVGISSYDNAFDVARIIVLPIVVSFLLALIHTELGKLADEAE